MRNVLSDKLLNSILVMAQFALIALLFYHSNGLFKSNIILIIRLLGLMLGCSAFWAMRKSKWGISPALKEGAILICSGPYRYIRHPMYTALLLFFVPDLGTTLTYIFLWLILLIVLLIKLRHEEQLLKKHLPRYEDYCQKTKQLIPFVY